MRYKKKKHAETNVSACFSVVESRGIEPLTSCMPCRRSPSWANPPQGCQFLISWLLYQLNVQMSSGFFKKIHKICQAKNTMKEKEKYEEIIVSACFSLVESRGIVRSELMQRMRSCREKDESTNNYQKMISYRKLFIYKLRSSSAVKVRYNFGLL